jgi:chromosome segregation ATPase
LKKKIIIGALGVMAGLALGLIYGHLQLAGEQKAHQTKLKEMSQRLSQTQRRYVEERTLHTSLEDDKQQAQNQLDALQKEKERLLGENRDLKAKADALEIRSASLDTKVASLETRASSLDTKNTQLAERLTKVEADRSALDQKQRQTFQTLQEREKELKQLTIDSHRQYDQCASHNARLYTIAYELIRLYENKGVVKSLLSKEPLIQVKKVELEKIVQDYKDKVNEQKLGAK